MSARGSKQGQRKSTAAKPVGALGHGDLPTSLLFVFPLFLAYEIGVMFSSTVNGADFVTRAVFAVVGSDRALYLAVHLVLAVAFLAGIAILRRKRRFEIRAGLPMLLESAIYALTVGSVIVLVMERLLGFSIVDPAIFRLADAELARLELGQMGQAVVSSLGAGVHEELVFRLGLFAGGAAVLRAVGLPLRVALLIALIVSSVLFSLAHHVGPLGETFETRVFVYRLLAGIVFSAIFYYRSLSHAVYTHFLYDVYVLVIRG